MPPPTNVAKIAKVASYCKCHNIEHQCKMKYNKKKILPSMCEGILRTDWMKPVLKTDSYTAIMVLRSEQELSACWQKISAHDKICSYDRQCRKRVFNSPLCFTVDEHTCCTIIRGKIAQKIFFSLCFCYCDQSILSFRLNI